MKKIEEIVNYEKFNELNYNALETKTKAFFTLYLILDTDDIDFNTIYSSLNQTFIDFEFLIFVHYLSSFVHSLLLLVGTYQLFP